MIDVINLSSYETPKALEDPRKGFVAYGEDNNYYEFLIDTYLHSATHNAAIKSISDQIYGEGLSLLNKEQDSKEVKELCKIIKKKDMKKAVLERKLLGQSALQVIYTGKGKGRTVKEVRHFPIHTLRPEKCNDMGEIEAYFYHPDWKNYKNTDVLKRIPCFGKSKESIELYIIRPYLSGHTYFSPVDYSGALSYAELEMQIGHYHLNDIEHGFSGSKVINFNNGTPSKEERDYITRDIKKKLTGARGEKVIVAFNDSKENATEVVDLPLNDAPAHYEYLADEARNKILVGHRITSPMLLGIRDGKSGLGNNADEIMTASQLFNSTVVKPYQDEIIDALEEILEDSEYVGEMYFVSIQPIEFQEGAEEAETAEEKEERTGVKGRNSEGKPNEVEKKKNTNLSSDLVELDDEGQINYLRTFNKIGEDEDLENWELVSAEIDLEESEDEDWEKYLNKSVKLSAQKNSTEDSAIFKVRYAYVHRSTTKSKDSKSKSRSFCSAIVAANKVYRKEDITKMKGLNTELGHNRQPYSIWMHKGGVNCYHGWERRIYKKAVKADGTPYGGRALDGTKKVNVNQAKAQGWKPKSHNKRVAEANIDRADKGHHPNYLKNRK